MQRLASITDARLKAGDISELEARTARSVAARVQVERRAVEHDRDLARVTLAALLGNGNATDQANSLSPVRQLIRPRADLSLRVWKMRSLRAPTCERRKSRLKRPHNAHAGSILAC